MSFGKAFLSSCLGAFVALLFFSVVVIFLVIGKFASLASEQEVVVENKSILHLKLDAEISEMQKENPLAGLPVPGGDVLNIGLLQLKDAIAHAKNDANIEGIFLDISYPATGFATLGEIRESLIDFRKSGKFVYSYSETLSEAAYYLVSASDKVFLNPYGEIEFNGLTAEVTFFKRMFDKLEIKPQIFRVGEFKSAVEPFLYEKMSEESKLQLTELLNSMYDEALRQISESRNVPVEKLEQLSDKMLISNAQTAIANGLIDSVLYKDQLQDILKKKLDISKTEDIKFIRYNRYRKSYSGYKSSKNEIAVIVAEGAIVPGDDGDRENVIQGEHFVDEIRKAREDEDVKAIVVRVNSPGGEFKASDMIWREITLARKIKPVIASMGDYAASGGYYIAMAADTIVAQPHTITGSIGIFAMMFDASAFLGNKLGVTFDEVRTGEFGEMYTLTRPLTEAEKNFWQRILDSHYETFTAKAAEGRGLSQDDIKKVASGRVWSGLQAKERGLVDVIGGFNDAVRIAASKANVGDDYKLRFYPRDTPFLEEFFNRLEENSEAKSLRSTLGVYYPWFQQLQRAQQYQGEQARMPFEFVIH